MAWFSIEACMVYLLYAGFARRSDRSAGIAAAVVAGESHLGHFALTGLLLPMMTCSPKTRVISATSMTHRRGHVDFGNLDGSKGYSAARGAAQP